MAAQIDLLRTPNGRRRLEAIQLDNDPESLQILKQSYEDLFAPAFPHPDWLETYENMSSYLSDNKGDLKNFKQGDHGYHIVVLRDPNNGRIVGGFVYDYLSRYSGFTGRTHDIAMLEYTVIDSEHRLEGFYEAGSEWAEKKLQEYAMIKGRELEVVLAEVSDPKKMTQQEIVEERKVMDPLKRRRWAQSVGFRGLDFDYVQPPIKGKREPARDLTLVAKPLVEQWKIDNRISSPVVAGWVADVYVPCFKDYPRRSPFVREMVRDILAKPFVKLKPLA